MLRKKFLKLRARKYHFPRSTWRTIFVNVGPDAQRLYKCACSFFDSISVKSPTERKEERNTKTVFSTLNFMFDNFFFRGEPHQGNWILHQKILGRPAPSVKRFTWLAERTKEPYSQCYKKAIQGPLKRELLKGAAVLEIDQGTFYNTPGTREDKTPPEKLRYFVIAIVTVFVFTTNPQS